LALKIQHSLGKMEAVFLSASLNKLAKSQQGYKLKEGRFR